MKRLHLFACVMIFGLMCSRVFAQTSNPFSYNFEVVSFYRMPGAARYDNQGQAANGQAIITGSRLYVLDSWGRALNGFDISDPAKPRLLFNLPVRYTSYTGMYINNGYAILAPYGWPPELVRLNDTNPTTQTTTIPGGILGQSGSILIVNDTTGRIQFWDITNPAAAYKISSKSAPQYVYGVTVAGSMLYIRGFVYDFSDVHNPQRIEANILDSYRYVVGSTGYRDDLINGFLRADDLSDPVNPRVLATYAIRQAQELENNDFGMSFIMDGALAFYVKLDEGLYAFDLSSPGTPNFVRGYCRLPNVYGAMATQNGLVYVFDSFNQTLTVYRYTGERPATNVHAAQLVILSPPSSIQSGKSGTATVKVKNTGTSAWGGSLDYNLAVISDPGNIVVDTNGRIAIPAGVTVQPGHEYTFQVPLLGPAKTGHYAVQLQMNHEFVTKFGPVISFDIDVVAGNSVQNWAVFN